MCIPIRSKKESRKNIGVVKAILFAIRMRSRLLILLFISYIRGQSLSLNSSKSRAVLGEGFQFTCSVDGGGSPQGNLYFNKNIASTVCVVDSAACSQFSHTSGYSCGCASGQTVVFYTNISSIRLEDSEDNWVCQYNGITSNTVKLNVLYPPSITSVPSSINITENTNPGIDCSSNITEGNPTSASYKWLGPKGYSRMGPTLDRIINRTTTGQYICITTNTGGLSDEAYIVIHVLYPPKITSVPSKIKLNENTNPGIDCSNNIRRGYPKVTNYTWQGPDGSFMPGSVLDKVITRTQGGQYICTATNTAGLSDKAEMTVDVIYPPVITSIPSNFNVTVNTSAAIDCSSNITPGNLTSTSFTWEGPGGYYLQEPILEKLMTRTDAGKYTCTVTNTAGLFDKAEINIDVMYPPVITSIPSNFNVTVNTSPAIDCSSNITPGNPTSTSFTWEGPGGYYLQEPILEILMTRTDAGKYTCTATNTAGLFDKAEINIDVMYKNKQEDDGLGHMGLGLGLGFGAGVLIVLIIMIVVYRKRNKNCEESNMALQDNDCSSENNSVYRQRDESDTYATNSVICQESNMVLQDNADCSSENISVYRQRDESDANAISVISQVLRRYTSSNLSSISNDIDSDTSPIIRQGAEW